MSATRPGATGLLLALLLMGCSPVTTMAPAPSSSPPPPTVVAPGERVAAITHTVRVGHTVAISLGSVDSASQIGPGLGVVDGDAAALEYVHGPLSGCQNQHSCTMDSQLRITGEHSGSVWVEVRRCKDPVLPQGTCPSGEHDRWLEIIVTAP